MGFGGSKSAPAPSRPPPPPAPPTPPTAAGAADSQAGTPDSTGGASLFSSLVSSGLQTKKTRTGKTRRSYLGGS